MLTAKAQDRDVLEGYTRGADMYLTKPFNPIELVTFAKRLLQSGADDGRTVI
jgi:two-component system alkaline phosphatase synthesis response regulator PhoP/two-component system response regulator VicR